MRRILIVVTAIVGISLPICKARAVTYRALNAPFKQTKLWLGSRVM
jgi:hypothetical protein